MKHYHIGALALVALFVFAACSNEDAPYQENSEQIVEEGTVFLAVENTENPKMITRTTGRYTGSSIKFYWTSGDRLWIKAPALTQSNKDDIDQRIASTADHRTDMAKFYFPGVYSESTYLLRYTGKNNPSGEKVTIKSSQTQDKPNDAAHIGSDGDCGTATANRQPDGTYKFTLDHKAAYLTFAPYYSKDELANTVTIKSIKVTANENLAGTYNFNDTGIETASVSDPSKSVTLALTGNFSIPKSSDYTKNGAIMVVAPGSYTNFKVEYTLSDSKTGVTGVISKTYNNVTLNAGKNKPVKFDLALTRYEMKYYMWDAVKDYWDGFTGTFPVVSDEAAGYNGDGTDRDYNHSNVESFSAANSCKVCPNANEAAIYVWKGNPHWDGTTLWVMNRHLYVGGMWFLKLQYCNGGPFTSPVTTYPGYGDYRENSRWKNWNESDTTTYHNYWKETPSQGKPTDTSKYFYLPAMGYLDNFNSSGKLKMKDKGYDGAYWTSTSVKSINDAYQAVSLHFSKEEVGLEVDSRKWGYPIFKVDGK